MNDPFSERFRERFYREPCCRVKRGTREYGLISAPQQFPDILGVVGYAYHPERALKRQFRHVLTHNAWYASNISLKNHFPDIVIDPSHRIIRDDAHIHDVDGTYLFPASLGLLVDETFTRTTRERRQTVIISAIAPDDTPLIPFYESQQFTLVTPQARFVVDDFNEAAAFVARVIDPGWHEDEEDDSTTDDDDGYAHE